MTSARPTLAHLDALTGVRALAALWVVLYHAWLVGGSPLLEYGFAGLRFDLTPWAAFGWLGVDIFFILSGFLLTRQEWIRQERAGAEKAVNGIRPFLAFCAAFLRRRIVRVYPAYYGCLTILIALAALHIYQSLPGRLELLLHLGMMHNAVDAYVSTMNGVFWSMPFEWQFYLAFPFLFVVLDRAGPWTLSLAVFAIVCSAKAYVVVTGDGSMHAQLPIRLDAFVFGMCAGRFSARAPLTRGYAVLAFYAGLLALLGTPLLFHDLPTGNHYYSVKGFLRPLWIQLGVILTLLGMTGDRHPGVAIFGNKVAVGLGLMSYSIYLLHFPVMEMLIMNRGKMGPLATIQNAFTFMLVTSIPLVLAVSAVSYRLIERPFQLHRAWRHHLWSKSGGSLLDRVDPLLVLMAWAMLLMAAREMLA
jgi:peptidoglycan/LPS O-acetylase OafA/YrhL